MTWQTFSESGEYRVSDFQVLQTADIQHFLPLFKELTEFNERFLLSMLRWCGYGRKRNRELAMWNVYVAFHLNKPIGVTGVYSEQGDPSERSWLGWFGIIPDYRRKRVGSYLFNTTCNISRSKGFSSLYIYTGGSDEKAISFYESIGCNKLGFGYEVFPNSKFDNFAQGNMILAFDLTSTDKVNSQSFPLLPLVV
jgi:ribosomal protein S18 acetylase RimI-like enzyme